MKVYSFIGIVVIAFLMFEAEATGQTSFKTEFRDKDPAPNSLPLDEQLEIHSKNLELSLKSNDTLTILYNYLYLIDDLITKSDFTEAMRIILKAENFVSKSGNEVWKGQVSQRKGSLYTYLGNYEDAIIQYEISLDQSTTGKDSQNMALNLEQLGAMHGYLKQYDVSDKYYQSAFALIEKSCSQTTLAIALSNYGNVKVSSGDFISAENAYLKAMNINSEIGHIRNESICKINLSSLYLETNRDKKALDMTLEGIKINKENDWPYLLVDNYIIGSDIYSNAKEWEKAYHYLKLHKSLSDSIIGTKVKNDITHLELENIALTKNLEISKAENNLNKVQKKYRNALLIGGLVFLSLLIVYVFFSYRKRKNEQQLKESRINVLNLTKTLSVKNAKILELETSLAKVKNQDFSNSEDTILNPYSDKILTVEDWHSFKDSFEKAYPKLIRKVRTKFPKISEAEERLLLLMRLELSSIEISNILGVLPNTVKKTRGRLRKRLEIDKEIPLKEFIRVFN